MTKPATIPSNSTAENNRDTSKSKGIQSCLGLLLGLMVFLAYYPASHNGFVNYDDLTYVVENTRVQAGLTWDGIRWAFQTSTASNWHPITWLSKML